MKLRQAIYHRIQNNGYKDVQGTQNYKKFMGATRNLVETTTA